MYYYTTDPVMDLSPHQLSGVIQVQEVVPSASLLSVNVNGATAKHVIGKCNTYSVLKQTHAHC